eukprot:s4270_g4.t1
MGRFSQPESRKDPRVPTKSGRFEAGPEPGLLPQFGADVPTAPAPPICERSLLLAGWSHQRCRLDQVRLLAAELVVETWGARSSREPSWPPTRPVAAASAPVAEDPEEGATLAELEISFLSPFDPETKSLEEYEVRLHQGVEMARPDCRDEAISRECCLGEAQFQTAFSRFTTLCRTTPTAARPDGPDHVLRATGAGISKLMQMWGADPVAIYYRYKGAAEAYSEAGGTDSSGRAGEAAVASRERERRPRAWVHEEDAPRSRSREPDGHEGARPQGNSAGAFDRAMSGAKLWGERGQATGTKPQTFDISSRNSGGESALLAIVARDAQAAGTGFGDGDADLDKHLEAFQDVCLYSPRTTARSFGLSPAMKARAKYDNLEKKSTAFQEFQVSWLEALTELNAAGVYKCQKDLLYDHLRKIGSFLREEVSRDRRFWPLRPSPGVQQEFRKPR